MPNHITNKLRVIGTKKQIKEVLNFTKIEKNEGTEVYGLGTIDFNKITPMPKWVFRGNLGREEEKKYGKANCWYDWSIKNWGTKWNAYGQTALTQEPKDIHTVYFKTAWSGVTDLIYKLARIFPEVTLEYSYYDEDMGYNLAKYIFKDTEILEQIRPEGGSKEAYELIFEIEETTAEDMGMCYNEETKTYEYNN